MAYRSTLSYTSTSVNVGTRITREWRGVDRAADARKVEDGACTSGLQSILAPAYAPECSATIPDDLECRHVGHLVVGGVERERPLVFGEVADVFYKHTAMPQRHDWRVSRARSSKLGGGGVRSI